MTDRRRIPRPACVAVALLSALLAAPATDARAATAQQEHEHGRYDFPSVVGGQEHILTYQGTHDVVRDADPNVKLVVFSHHGGSQNPVTYFDRMQAALDSAHADQPARGLKGTTLIVAPNMIGDHHLADNPQRYASGHYPYWDGGWREGANSLNSPAVSNYDLLDRMVLHIVNRFPGVKAIVHVGHSAGGQLVSRYSVGTPVYDSLRARGIFVRYIIANPSSVLYFDRQRPNLGASEGFLDYGASAPVVAGAACSGFNDYKYGLDDRVPYMTRRPVAAMLAGFREREVFMLQGLEDNDPTGDGVDQDCPGLLQGRTRLERGQRYYEYWGHFFGPQSYRNKFIELVPGVGHHSGEMFRSEPAKAIIFIDADSAAAAIGQGDPAPDSTRFVLAIHGGGGVRDRAAMTPEVEAEYRAALTEALTRGHAVLRGGGSSVAAVEAAIRVMEDSPLFNAGKGASYNRDGYHELDTSIMDGSTLAAGAAAVVQRVKNPISLARAVMEKSPHVLIAGEGALDFARAQGLEIVAPHYFFTERKWESLQRRLAQETPYGTSPTADTGARAAPSPPPRDDPADNGAYGTVGAVALDRAGNLAAGTSTGGREGKLPGRVGDTPIIGAGTYANNATLAISSTGLGEYVMRLVAAKDMSDLMDYRGLSVTDATAAVVAKIVAMGGGIGVVAVDRQGNLAMPFAGDGMYRGHVREDGKVVVQVYREP